MYSSPIGHASPVRTPRARTPFWPLPRRHGPSAGASPGPGSRRPRQAASRSRAGAVSGAGVGGANGLRPGGSGTERVAGEGQLLLGEVLRKGGDLPRRLSQVPAVDQDLGEAQVHGHRARDGAERHLDASGPAHRAGRTRRPPPLRSPGRPPRGPSWSAVPARSGAGGGGPSASAAANRWLPSLRWVTSARTSQSVHGVGRDHCSGGMPAMSSPAASRAVPAGPPVSWSRAPPRQFTSRPSMPGPRSRVSRASRADRRPASGPSWRRPAARRTVLLAGTGPARVPAGPRETVGERPGRPSRRCPSSACRCWSCWPCPPWRTRCSRSRSGHGSAAPAPCAPPPAWPWSAGARSRPCCSWPSRSTTTATSTAPGPSCWGIAGSSTSGTRSAGSASAAVEGTVQSHASGPPAAGRVRVLPDPGWSSTEQWPTRGRVESVTIRGVRSGLTSHAFVYLPPQYFQKEFASRALPRGAGPHRRAGHRPGAAAEPEGARPDAHRDRRRPGAAHGAGDDEPLGRAAARHRVHRRPRGAAGADLPGRRRAGGRRGVVPGQPAWLGGGRRLHRRVLRRQAGHGALRDVLRRGDAVRLLPHAAGPHHRRPVGRLRGRPRAQRPGVAAAAPASPAGVAAGHHREGRGRLQRVRRQPALPGPRRHHRRGDAGRRPGRRPGRSQLRHLGRVTCRAPWPGCPPPCRPRRCPHDLAPVRHHRTRRRGHRLLPGHRPRARRGPGRRRRRGGPERPGRPCPGRGRRRPAPAHGRDGPRRAVRRHRPGRGDRRHRDGRGHGRPDRHLRQQRRDAAPGAVRRSSRWRTGTP